MYINGISVCEPFRFDIEISRPVVQKMSILISVQSRNRNEPMRPGGN